MTPVCCFPFSQRNFVCLGPGFTTQLDRIKNLPYCETETFEVRFDPQGANLPVGNKEVLLPIKVRWAHLSLHTSYSAHLSSLGRSSDYSKAGILSPTPCHMVNSNLLSTPGGWRANSSHLSPSQGDHSNYDPVLWKNGVCHSSVWTVHNRNCSALQSSPGPL